MPTTIRTTAPPPTEPPIITALDVMGEETALSEVTDVVVLLDFIQLVGLEASPRIVNKGVVSWTSAPSSRRNKTDFPRPNLTRYFAMPCTGSSEVWFNSDEDPVGL